MKELTIAWLDAAFLDVKSAQRLLEDDFFTPIVCFHSQQCVEKALKAILEEVGAGVPKIHNVLKLYELASAHTKIECDLERLQEINDIYIDARYPGEFGLLPNGKPTLDDANTFYQFALHFYETISVRLK